MINNKILFFHKHKRREFKETHVFVHRTAQIVTHIEHSLLSVLCDENYTENDGKYR